MIKVEKAWFRFIQVVSVNPSVKGRITVFSSRVSLLPLYTSRKFKRTSLLTCTRQHNGSLTEDKDKAGSPKVNKSWSVKEVTVTTNNRIQAGFNSARRKKAKHRNQTQLTNRMHN